MRMSDWSSDVCSSDLAHISPISNVASGVVGAGLHTMVLPATSAGGSFSIRSMIGKFHGVIAATTPRAENCCTIFSSSVAQKRGVPGKRVSVRVDLVGRRISHTTSIIYTDNVYN